MRLDRLKFMFFRDALVWFAVALEAVLEFAVAFGKLRQNFITAGAALRNRAAWLRRTILPTEKR